MSGRDGAPFGVGTARWLGVAATALAGSALFNRWSKERAERKYPPVGSFVEVGGLPVHYVDQGVGPAIVMIHGSGSLVQDFIVSGLVERLAKRHRVILIDRPGYGYTARPRQIDWTPERQAALLMRVCDALDVDRPMVVGHSWGTLPALAWALDYPDRISQLTVISGYFYPTPRPDAALTATAGAPVIGDLIVNTIAPLQTRVTGRLGNRMIFSPAVPTSAFLNEMPFGLMLRPSQLRATAADSGQMPASAARFAPRYPQLALPMAILWGDGDKLIGQDGQSGRLAQALPHAAALELEGAGHMLHHSHMDLIAEVLDTLGGAGTLRQAVG